jgi:hypothetical protein
MAGRYPGVRCLVTIQLPKALAGISARGSRQQGHRPGSVATAEPAGIEAGRSGRRARPANYAGHGSTVPNRAARVDARECRAKLACPRRPVRVVVQQSRGQPGYLLVELGFNDIAWGINTPAGAIADMAR